MLFIILIGCILDSGRLVSSPSVFTSDEYRAWLTRAPSSSAIYQSSTLRGGPSLLAQRASQRLAFSSENLPQRTRQVNIVEFICLFFLNRYLLTQFFFFVFTVRTFVLNVQTRATCSDGAACSTFQQYRPPKVIHIRQTFLVRSAQQHIGSSFRQTFVHIGQAQQHIGSSQFHIGPPQHSGPAHLYARQAQFTRQTQFNARSSCFHLRPAFFHPRQAFFNLRQTQFNVGSSQFYIGQAFNVVDFSVGFAETNAQSIGTGGKVHG